MKPLVEGQTSELVTMRLTSESSKLIDAVLESRIKRREDGEPLPKRSAIAREAVEIGLRHMGDVPKRAKKLHPDSIKRAAERAARRKAAGCKCANTHVKGCPLRVDRVRVQDFVEPIAEAVDRLGVGR